MDNSYRLTWLASIPDPRAEFQRNPVPSNPTVFRNGILSIQPFSFTIPAWTGASYIIAQATLALTYTQFTIQVPIQAPSDYFIACVSWFDGVNMHRYRLWDNARAMLVADLYSGQTMPNTAKLEIWSVRDFPDRLTVELAAAWELLIGNLFVPPVPTSSGSTNILGSNQNV